ncbi:MAG: hypothetical protein JW990_06890 [Thermoleophilia bacterium]|nr:hypothetical protein [Thermoleophilia bacterium]
MESARDARFHWRRFLEYWGGKARRTELERRAAGHLGRELAKRGFSLGAAALKQEAEDLVGCLLANGSDENRSLGRNLLRLLPQTPDDEEGYEELRPYLLVCLSNMVRGKHGRAAQLVNGVIHTVSIDAIRTSGGDIRDPARGLPGGSELEESAIDCMDPRFRWLGRTRCHILILRVEGATYREIGEELVPKAEPGRVLRQLMGLYQWLERYETERAAEEARELQEQSPRSQVPEKGTDLVSTRRRSRPESRWALHKVAPDVDLDEVRGDVAAELQRTGCARELAGRSSGALALATEYLAHAVRTGHPWKGIRDCLGAEFAGVSPGALRTRIDRLKLSTGCFKGWFEPTRDEPQ